MAMSKLHKRWSGAYQLARESSEVAEAALIALLEVFPGAGATLRPFLLAKGEGEPERHWMVKVILPDGSTLEARGRTSLEAAERLVLDQG